MEAPSDTVKLPSNRKDKQQILRKRPMRMTEQSHNQMFSVIAQRATLNHEEVHLLGCVETENREEEMSDWEESEPEESEEEEGSEDSGTDDEYE